MSDPILEKAPMADGSTEMVEMTAPNRDLLKVELRSLLNRHSAENESDTPDFILSEYMMDCLAAFEKATLRRTKWYIYPNDLAADPDDPPGAPAGPDQG